MERIDTVLGNVHADDDLAVARDDHDRAGTLERLVIDADRRRRSRFRTTTDAGTDVGVVLERAALSAGDVLLCEDDRMIVVAFEPLEAFAVDLPEPSPATLEAAVELGHRVGNQHWDLAVEAGTVYVPLEADRHIVERVVADVVPGSEIREVTVEADLFVTDVDAEPSEHDHHHHDSSHEHEHGHTHDHGHSDGDQHHSHARCHDDGDAHHHHHGHDHTHDHDH
ncbi:urease accessory protein UreE [Natrarchaeobaculum aegyptiacum]|uniref:Urease accessory protein UreE n=1 Tax=Natrarchaeobaculum aegyptiacum TaxID=745377 RepID=A0A2Z2HP61_9EURY|nr:urease accessory protein UreE [Natrarchaeobaculum aegyptiacum]ARS88796.1 urease accessory protein UreE [Natrarchaeobaculum aegyptiacum]